MNTIGCFHKNDIIFNHVGETTFIQHQKSLFANITVNTHNPQTWLVEVYKSSGTGINILLDTTFARYFLVKDKKVLCYPLTDFVSAKQLADTFDWQRWVAMQTEKGLPKKQLVDDVKNHQMTACQTFTGLKGRVPDTAFHPLVKTKGRGSVDIVRDGKPSVLFYLNSMPANLMRYTGDELVIYINGFRLCDNNEMECLLEWEKRRDKQAERLDSMTDSSGQFYRKKDFFENRGYGYLLNQRFKGLVQDDNIRQAVLLKYKLKKVS